MRGARMSVGVLLIFAAGFLAGSGREAAVSGSWQYVLQHDDEYAYWMMAEGGRFKPRSTQNPFYREDLGVEDRFHPSPWILAFSRLAGFADRPVLFFYPVWKIFMPFLVWCAVTFCAVRHWGFARRPAAMTCLLVLIGTLYLAGPVQYTLLRFPRPGGGLWLAALWISVTMTRMARPWALPCVMALGLAVLYVDPYYAFLGVWVTAAWLAWDGLICRSGSLALRHAAALAVIGGAATIRLSVMTQHLDESYWLTLIFYAGNSHGAAFPGISWALFAGVGAAVLTANRLLSRAWDPLDRAVLVLYLADPVLASLQGILGQDGQLGDHRYYFFTLQTLAWVAWLVRKGVPALGRETVRPWHALIAMALMASQVFAWVNPAYAYWNGFPVPRPVFRDMDVSRVLAGWTALLTILIWLPAEFQRIRQIIARPCVAWTALFAVALLGFAFCPSQLEFQNRNYPFTGAFRWLRGNAAAHDVVLTVPRRRAHIDYLPFYTGLQCYYNHDYGQRFSKNTDQAFFRRLFYGALLSGVLPGYPLPQAGRMEEKLAHLRLDYILAESGTGAEETVRGQLGPWIEEVYRDPSAVLWRVRQTRTERK